MIRRLTVIMLATAALATTAPAMAAPAAPARESLREATALAQKWGRCPTSRPAHSALAQARRAPTAARAEAALMAWRGVADVCSAPVAMPTAVVGG